MFPKFPVSGMKRKVTSPIDNQPSPTSKRHCLARAIDDVTEHIVAADQYSRSLYLAAIRNELHWLVRGAAICDLIVEYTGAYHPNTALHTSCQTLGYDLFRVRDAFEDMSCAHCHGSLVDTDVGGLAHGVAVFSHSQLGRPCPVSARVGDICHGLSR